ncbi:hypothetical protein HYC85_001050 [Camellia sinensis]|uniref:Quinolinate phosphoribosyl transferase C-terminal domain-containing protein n=1 Tax=Camellia sinensis TaxID=4442 RepID=A0A7J7I5H8_CAMSI|nr:hypothetical protein HYC85_001050 [Camellia sinensis]
MADAAHPAFILETRKTAPGLRLVDKWVVLIGGGRNHIMGLFDMVMIKDNHKSVAGGVKDALRSVGLYLKKNNLHIGVECVRIWFAGAKDKRLGVKRPVKMPTKMLSFLVHDDIFAY